MVPTFLFVISHKTYFRSYVRSNSFYFQFLCQHLNWAYHYCIRSASNNRMARRLFYDIKMAGSMIPLGNSDWPKNRGKSKKLDLLYKLCFWKGCQGQRVPPPPHPGFKSFHFHAVLGTNWLINRLVPLCTEPSWKSRVFHWFHQALKTLIIWSRDFSKIGI